MNLLIDGIIFQDQSTGGISRIFSEILPLMTAIDEDLRISILTSGKLRQPIPEDKGIRHTQLLPISDILKPRRFWYRLHEFLRQQLISEKVKRSHDHIWLSTYYTMPPSDWRGETIAFVYDLIPEKYTHVFNKQGDASFREKKRKAITSAEKVICISETTRSDVLDFYDLDEDRVSTAHLAHSPVFRLMTNQTPTQHFRNFLLYVGRRSHYKNFHFFLEAYANWTNHSHVDLVVVGGPWVKTEKELLEKYNLLNQVHLLPTVSDALLAELYNSATAFVYPSLYEGFGIPLLEAMACGCPVVASDIPSSREIAADCAYYFDPNNSNSLHAALDQAVQKGKSGNVLQRALERASQFSWENTARSVHRYIKETSEYCQSDR